MKKIFCLSLLLVLLLSACGSENAAADIPQKVNEELGITPYIPEHPDYPIGLAAIQYGLQLEKGEAKNGEAQSVNVSYLLSTDKKFDGMGKEEWEKENQQEIIYGDFYTGAPVISMMIYKDSYGSLHEATKEEIEGQEVEYLLMERDVQNIAVMGFDIQNMGYLITYYLLDGQTEDDAKKFAGEIISNLN